MPVPPIRYIEDLDGIEADDPMPPTYRGRGIGTELLTRALARLGARYSIDLLCDDELIPYYERLGSTRLTAMAIRHRDALAEDDPTGDAPVPKGGSTMTHDDVQAWLDRYVDAWKRYDETAIGDLFSDDATYRYHPWDAPIRGREAIVRDWLAPNGDASGRDVPGTFEATYQPYAVDGDRAVAVGSSDYFDGPGGPLDRRYHNVFVLAFDGDGRCREFTELFMAAPGGRAASQE